jgi:hypothetical protein
MFDGCSSLTTAPALPASGLKDYCYDGMFLNCTGLTTAPKLPATTLADACYSVMFSGCTALTTSPELPATKLVDYCYNGMFQDCTNLTNAPELPATTLASNCYGLMFLNCKKLNYIKMLATNISASDCLFNWVIGVASSGTFVKNPIMNSLPTGVSGIPSGWTVVNDDELTFPIKLYEGQNDPEYAAKVIEYTYNNWNKYANEEGQIEFEEIDPYPTDLPQINNIVHLNDTYYCTGFLANEDMLWSFDAHFTTHEMNGDQTYDIMHWYLDKNGILTIYWD